MKSFVPGLPSAKGLNHWRSGALFLLVLALLGLVSRYAGTGSSAKAMAVLPVAAACFLWCLHLKTGALRWYWSYPLTVLLACQLLPPILRQSTIPVSAWLSALGCGLFVYAMLWVSAMHEGEPGLRPLATLALLLSIGVLAKPAVAVACALLSVLFFFRSRSRFGGILGSALLLLTPVVLCALAFLVLNLLTTGVIHGAIFHTAGMFKTQSMGKLDLLLLIQESPALWFSLVVLLSRAFERKTGVSDVSYFMLIASLSTAGVAHWMPNALSQIDIQMIVYAGAACLLALAPPRKAFCLMLVLAGAFVPLLKQIPF